MFSCSESGDLCQPRDSPGFRVIFAPGDMVDFPHDYRKMLTYGHETNDHSRGSLSTLLVVTLY